MHLTRIAYDQFYGSAFAIWIVLQIANGASKPHLKIANAEIQIDCMVDIIHWAWRLSAFAGTVLAETEINSIF